MMTITRVTTLAAALGFVMAGRSSAATVRWDGDTLSPVALIGGVPAPGRFLTDPGDSLYRAARQALNDGNYKRAAELFGQIPERLPQSAYAGDALYWQAFALYRRGGSDELRRGLHALSAQEARYPKAGTRQDAPTLRARINGKLAQLGDADAAAALRTQVAPPEKGACSGGDDDMRVAALNALLQTDAEEALPILKQVLARRDECSEPLRKKAVFLVAQKESEQTADILLHTARTDPSADVRQEAVFWLGQVPSDRAVSVLDSILRTATDDEMREKAIFALSQQRGSRAHAILRALASGSPGASEDLQGKAIFALGHFSDNADDRTFLRELFPRLKSDQLKEQVIQSVAQGENEGSGRWLLSIATDRGQDLELRKKALFWGGQGRIATAQLAQLYDQLPEPELKEQLIFVLSQRDDSASVDKLVDVARHDPNRELRKKAIFWLGQKNDPRVRQLLLEIINGSR